VAGAENSTSQVTNMMSAPLPISPAAHAFALAGLLLFVSQVWITTLRPLTPPRALSCFTRTCAAASAGPSNGAMLPFESKAQPITIGSFTADVADPATIAATAATAVRSASSAPLFLALILPSCGLDGSRPRAGRIRPLRP
jgi:hypothetical protein